MNVYKIDPKFYDRLPDFKKEELTGIRTFGNRYTDTMELLAAVNTGKDDFGDAIAHSRSLRNTPSAISLMAASGYPEAAAYASALVLQDPDNVKTLIYRNPNAYSYLPRGLQQVPDFIEAYRESRQNTACSDVKSDADHYYRAQKTKIDISDPEALKIYFSDEHIREAWDNLIRNPYPYVNPTIPHVSYSYLCEAEANGMDIKTPFLAVAEEYKDQIIAGLAQNPYGRVSDLADALGSINHDWESIIIERKEKYWEDRVQEVAQLEAKESRGMEMKPEEEKWLVEAKKFIKREELEQATLEYLKNDSVTRLYGMASIGQITLEQAVISAEMINSIPNIEDAVKVSLRLELVESIENDYDNQSNGGYEKEEEIKDRKLTNQELEAIIHGSDEAFEQFIDKLGYKKPEIEHNPIFTSPGDIARHPEYSSSQNC